MIDRICISINNRCNLHCRYCHFHEKGKIESQDMDVFKIIANVKKYDARSFKIGFVGNGEGFLDWPLLKSYIAYLEDSQNISVYTITNGTVNLSDDDWKFLENHKVRGLKKATVLIDIMMIGMMSMAKGHIIKQQLDKIRCIKTI